MREQLLSNENPSEAQAGKAIAGADTPSPPATFFWIVAATLTLIVAIPIWLCDYFPSHNGPSLLLISYIEYAFGVPELGFADYFECHPFPIPYLLNSIVVQTLFAFFDPVTADKLWVTVLVCTRPWAVIYFLRQLQPGREFLGLISYLFVYDFSMMRGYYNYFAGVSLAFVLLGYYIRHRSHWNAWSTAALNALVLLQYFIHPFALVVSGLMLAAYEISVSRSPARILEIVVRGFIPSIVLLVAYQLWSAKYGTWGSSELVYSSVYEKAKNLLERGPSPLSTQVAHVTFFLIVAVGMHAVVCLFRSYGKPQLRFIKLDWVFLQREPMWLVFACGVLLYLVMPRNMTGWHKADIRIIPLLFTIVLALPTAIRGPRARGLFTLAIAASVIATLVPISFALRSLSADVVEFTAGINHFPRNVRFLTLVKRQWGDAVRIEDGFDSMKHVDSYYAIRRGGAPHDCLAWNNTVYTVWYKDYQHKPSFPRIPDQPTAEEVLAATARYGAILLWNQSQAAESPWQRAGFETIYQHKRLTILAKPTKDAS